MTYTEMDEDTVNELNAEVARQRAAWQQPDPDEHLAEAYSGSAEMYLTVLATCARVYEALKRKEARAKPAVVLNHPDGTPFPICKLCGGNLDLALTCEFCQERGGA